MMKQGAAKSLPDINRDKAEKKNKKKTLNIIKYQISCEM